MEPLVNVPCLPHGWRSDDVATTAFDVRLQPDTPAATEIGPWRTSKVEVPPAGSPHRGHLEATEAALHLGNAGHIVRIQHPDP